MRALQSYQEAKWKRQKKIKSKQYHRLKKRTERRQLLKELEELREKVSSESPSVPLNLSFQPFL